MQELDCGGGFRFVRFFLACDKNAYSTSRDLSIDATELGQATFCHDSMQQDMIGES